MSWWGNHPDWLRLSPTERAAAMALLEADNRDGKIDMDSARNALGAMINRSNRDRQDLGEHVSGRIYQPTTEQQQFARLSSVVGSPEHQQLVALANQRLSGQTPDWVNGATHFLAHEPVMERLTSENPGRYRSWPGWSGYARGGGQYSNPDGSPVIRDRSHAFLAPEGRHSASFGYEQPPDGMDAYTMGAPGTMAPPSRTPNPTAAPATVARAPSSPLAAIGSILGFTPQASADAGQPAATRTPGAAFGSMSPSTSNRGLLDMTGDDAELRTAQVMADASRDVGASPIAAAPLPRVDLSRLRALLKRRALGTAIGGTNAIG